MEDGFIFEYGSEDGIGVSCLFVDGYGWGVVGGLGVGGVQVNT